MNSRPGFSLELKVALHPVPELYLRRARPEAPPPLSPITGGPIKLKFGMNLDWVELHGGSPAELKILTPSWVFIKIKGHFELICIK